MDKNLMMTLCLILAILCWAVAAAFALRGRKDAKAVIRAAGIGVFASLFFFIYPYAVAESGAFAVPFALLQVIATAVVASDPLAIFELLNLEYSVSYLRLYEGILIVLHAVAPMFTLGITLSFFESKFAPWLYRIRSSRRESHIFSDINDRTLCLAESIYAFDKRSIIVFLGDSEKVEEQRECAERIKELGGYILDVSPCEVRHSLKKTRTYYLLGKDSGRNLKDAIRLFERFDKVGGEKVKLWLYSKDEISSVIFDNLDEKIDIRLINEEQLLAMGLMQSYPLYRGVKDNKLVFLLLGAGHIGLEILKNALWCSRFGEDFTSEYHVIDQNADYAAEKLEKLCPGISERYHVKFYRADVETVEYTELLKTLKPTYAVATLGQEQLNISACIEMRRIYGFDGELPLIHVLIDRADTASMILDNLQISDWSFNKQSRAFEKKELCSFKLLPFGSYSETYNRVRFSRGYYDALAMAINAVRCGITYIDKEHNEEKLRDLLNKVEFYKNFSYAYATAIPYKLWLMGLEFREDGKGDLTALEAEIPVHEAQLLSQEEQRWVCYMSSIGWQTMPIDQVSGTCFQDKLRRLHARLDASKQAQLGRIVGRDFERENREDLYRLPTIIQLANELHGKPYSVKYKKEDEKHE